MDKSSMLVSKWMKADGKVKVVWLWGRNSWKVKRQCIFHSSETNL